MRRGAMARVGHQAYTPCRERRHDSLRTLTTEAARPCTWIPGRPPLRETATTSCPRQAMGFTAAAATKDTTLETGTRITTASPARGRS